MTKALAMEYVNKPIRFNAVAPGGMATGMGKTIKFPPDTDFALVKRYSGLRGLVEVDDVADLITMLASPAGRGFHGACLTIDKGITAG
jgi:NAD(P)-dependent dehydrogenase (short-subunit alcohol dehydrogenase family)